MYKVCLLLLLIVVLACSSVLAQKPTQPIRIELELDSYKTDADLIATPDSSLLLFTKTEGMWSVPPTFEFTKYNSQLQPVWTKKVDLKPISQYLTHYSEARYAHVAFSGDNEKKYQFVKLNLKSGNITKHDYTIEAIDSIYSFEVVADNYFIVARSRKDGTPTLLHLNQASGEIKPLPAAYGAESAFSDVLAHPQQKQVSVVMSESNGRVSRLQTKLFDAGGTLLKNYFILPELDKRPLYAEVTPGDTTTRLLIGNYATRNLRYATGFFTVPVNSNAADTRYYSFLQLKNFFKYMSPKREARTRRRETNRLKAGKEPNLQYRLLLHDIYTTPDGYILSAEAYTTNSRQGGFNRLYGPTGYFLPSPKSYRRTQAVALGFDKSGVLLWDNSFPLQDIESRELRPTVEVACNPAGKVVIAYPDKDEIEYKIMDQDTYIEDKTNLKLQPEDPNGKILSTSMAGVVSWYGLNFAAFGWHRIKSPGSDIKQVFYINKVSF
ncbi:hypothetical protein [Pontibacter fetidus]|uniref:DUF4340 domain-containing protein n=1 Tax=Pontibacter fetidus TaxID=2700082 RepID=A0A6B2H4H9_9BACT|nr:hypothetical protein [Pontibacter fetidus]NDK55227.1 hypothetical protein [Pontibacter fetidus]